MVLAARSRREPRVWVSQSPALPLPAGASRGAAGQLPSSKAGRAPSQEGVGSGTPGTPHTSAAACGSSPPSSEERR